MQAEARASLIGDVPNPAEVTEAFRTLDRHARDLPVTYQGNQRSLQEVLQRGDNPRTDPLHVIVHPELPAREDGRAFLKHRAESVENEHRTDQSASAIAALWSAVFQHEIHSILQSHGIQTVIIHDPHSQNIPQTQAALSVQSIDVGTEYQSGFLPPQNLAKLLERMGAILPQTDVRIHGSSFGACPTGSTLQLAAASIYGTYLRDENSAEGSVIVEAMGRTAALRDQTHIRMGTLLDYAGMHEWLRRHPQYAGIFRLFDGDTKVIPDHNQALMRGADLLR